jgi:hypothetical protein
MIDHGRSGHSGFLLNPEFLQHAVDIHGHGYLKGLGFTIEINRETKIISPSPIDLEIVTLLQRADEEVNTCSISSLELDTKVIDMDEEGDRQSLMSVEAGSVRALVEAAGGEQGVKLKFGEQSSLRKTINGLLNTEEYGISWAKMAEMPLLQDHLGDEAGLHAEVLRPIQTSVKEKVLNIDGAESTVRVGDDRIEQAFDRS